MSNLLQFQRRVAAAVMQPLTRQDGMRRRTSDGLSMVAEAQALVKPNRVLESFERLEIYNRQYWFRVLNAFSDDFPGLKAVVGSRTFEGLMQAYLIDCPSQSFTLRNLGSRLESWLTKNREWIASCEQLALDMVRLEWAHIETFDARSEPVLSLADLELASEDIRLALQPYIQLLTLAYPVDDLLITVHNKTEETEASSNAAAQRRMHGQVRYYAELAPEPIFMAVHRVEDSVYYKRLDRESYLMLRAISESMPLETAVDVAFTGSSMPDESRFTAVQQWFANWAELGWFCQAATRKPDYSIVTTRKAS